MKVLHIITSLESGGAQWVLIQLIKQLRQNGYEQSVICMKPKGELAPLISELGIPVYEFGFSLRNLFNVKRQCEYIITSFQPDLIQSWLYHADFLTVLLNVLPKIPIIWGVHHTYEPHSQSRIKASTRIVVKINAVYSKSIPQRIVCCSRSALESHSRIGYAKTKMVVIPNGVDNERFKPDPKARLALRLELGLSPDIPLIGYIARYHPQKDHATFFAAANLALEKNMNIHFVLAGDQIDVNNSELQKYLKTSNNISHFHFLGRRSDIPMITAGLDVATLSSSGDEAFPLTMIEAMACEIPCVATDVGDVKEMLEPCGIIVSPRDPQALSQGWTSILNLNPEERTALGIVARDRFQNYYTDEIMAKHYIDVYNHL
jgi:glycosyltransferase involved in cell wall biosynthesis